MQIWGVKGSILDAIQQDRISGVHHRLDKNEPGNLTEMIRNSVTRLRVVEAGYLKGGLKRRIAQQIHINRGVELCGK